MQNNNNYGPMMAEAGAFALFGFALNFVERFIFYAMEPDVFVEEKKYLRNNRETLRKNFTK